MLRRVGGKIRVFFFYIFFRFTLRPFRGYQSLRGQSEPLLREALRCVVVVPRARTHSVKLMRPPPPRFFLPPPRGASQALLSPLHWAASSGYLDVAVALLEKGADVAAKCKVVRSPSAPNPTHPLPRMRSPAVREDLTDRWRTTPA